MKIIDKFLNLYVAPSSEFTSEPLELPKGLQKRLNVATSWGRKKGAIIADKLGDFMEVVEEKLANVLYDFTEEYKVKKKDKAVKPAIKPVPKPILITKPVTKPIAELAPIERPRFITAMPLNVPAVASSEVRARVQVALKKCDDISKLSNASDEPKTDNVTSVTILDPSPYISARRQGR
ncbi:hypothetical protein FACS189425_09390 [Clostridia bacterium]|nr:hypothetical protein FACS189425_09390 [Clostridia bacterium]